MKEKEGELRTLKSLNNVTFLTHTPSGAPRSPFRWPLSRLPRILPAPGESISAAQITKRENSAARQFWIVPITIGEGAGWQTAELHPAPGETVSFSAAGIPGAQDASELRLHAVVHNAASPGAALHEFTTLLPVKRMLDGLLNRSFYSLDDMALLKLRIALPPAVLASASLVWQVADLTAELSAGSLQSEQILTIPLDRLEARKHPLQVHLY
ncbi:MAG: hypothetical protein M0Q95_21520, partial [Porticoccaceae bacterium]|nr:hypothetical protein [Porticoccaceae bacterium]